MQILTSGDLKEVPWKNGGGTTRNIATGQMGKATAWRISRADVARDGAFSDFAGMTRILTVVSGNGMELDFPGGTLDAALWQPVVFDGALPIRSRLRDGALTDLNVMFAPSLCAATITVHKGPCDQTIAGPEAGRLVLHGLSGAPTVDGTSLHPGDTAFPDAPTTALALSAGDALLEINIATLDHSAAIRLCIAER